MLPYSLCQLKNFTVYLNTLTYLILVPSAIGNISPPPNLQMNTKPLESQKSLHDCRSHPRGLGARFLQLKCPYKHIWKYGWIKWYGTLHLFQNNLGIAMINDWSRV